MFAHYPERFEREMGCTEAEWQRALPAALGERAWAAHAHALTADVGAGGRLRLEWRVGTPRVIALMRMPRLHVSFAFEGVDDAMRQAFMKRFDLYMQRGGG